MIGQHIGSYQIVELLGEGGMGTVYRATDNNLGREVAIKVLHHHLSNNKVLLARFKNEALLSAKINHPNVATLYQLLEYQNRDYLIMEFIEGDNLEKALKKGERFSADKAIDLLIQLAHGLGSAHAKGIIHRDIKPGNIIINTQGYVKLMDFGIALVSDSSRLTKLNHVIGTNGYLAPELLQGENPSVGSDLYAVGVLGHELLNGCLPSEVGKRPDATPGLSFNAKPTQIAESYKIKKLQSVLKRLLNKDPKKRYANTGELIAVLQEIKAGRSEAAHIPYQISGLIKNTATILKSIAGNIAERLVTLVNLENLAATREVKIIGVSALFALVILIASLFTPANTPREYSETANGQEVTIPTSLAEPIKQESKPLNYVESNPEAEKTEEESQNTPLPSAPPQSVTKKILNPQESDAVTAPEQAQSPSEKRRVEPTAIDKQDQDKIELVKKQAPEKDYGLDDHVANETITEQTKEELPIIEKTATKKRISAVLPEQEITGVLTSDISSNVAHQGQTFFLVNQTDIKANGFIIIEKGARIKAIVKDAVSSTKKAKAFLAIQIIAIETVDGQWTPLQYPTYSDRAGQEIVFKKGLTLRKLRLKQNTLNIEITQ
jgi:serine/threonine-protein kinase